jgi:hypothetical protein
VCASFACEEEARERKQRVRALRLLLLLLGLTTGIVRFFFPRVDGGGRVAAAAAGII